MKPLLHKSRFIVTAVHLPLTLMLSTLSSGAEILQIPALTNPSDIIQEFVEIPADLPSNLIDHENHHSKLTMKQREGLVKKGYSLLTSIINGEDDTFCHKLEFLAHYKELDDHWKLPGVAYGDKSRREIILETAKFVTTTPVYYLYNKVTSCFWTTLESSDDKLSEDKASESEDIDAIECLEDLSWEYKRKAQLESVVSLIWALYDMSYKTGNAFVRGSIVLDDSNQRIHDYLEKYCCLASNVVSPELLSSAVYNPWGSNLAYNRQGRSSHFIGRTITHYGIDTRFQGRNFALGVLPYSMTHLLFGRVETTTGEEVTFIKAEEEGLGDLRAATKHALNYALAIPGTRMRREKDIPREIASGFFKLFESFQENPAFFDVFVREKSTNEVPKLFLSKLHQKIVKPTDFEKSETIDIAWMYGFLWDIKQDKLDNTETLISDDMFTQVNSLLVLLEKLYPPETLFMRTGNEVLFSDKDLYGILGIPFMQGDKGGDGESNKKSAIT